MRGSLTGAILSKEGDEAIGVLALKLINKQINTIVSRREGMGETGETCIVGQTGERISFRTDAVVQKGKENGRTIGNELGSFSPR